MSRKTYILHVNQILLLCNFFIMHYDIDENFLFCMQEVKCVNFVDDLQFCIFYLRIAKLVFYSLEDFLGVL